MMYFIWFHFFYYDMKNLNKLGEKKSNKYKEIKIDEKIKIKTTITAYERIKWSWLKIFYT